MGNIKRVRSAIRPEHDFTGSLEEWEARVFSNADHFNTHRRLGRGKQDSRTFKTFPEAVEDATPDRLALIYVVTASERFFCIERKKWPEYLEKWYAKHPKEGPR